MPAKRKRDIYGNWTWDEGEKQEEPVKRPEQIKLEWKDVVALTIASLQTFLLPIVVFLVVLFVLAVAFAHL